MYQWTPLHSASCRGHFEVVKVLLEHSNINVNVKSKDGSTPLALGCWSGYASIVQLLLKDPRVNVALDDNYGCTPLWYASRDGHCEVIEWLIASGRDLGDVESKKGKVWENSNDHTAVEIARENNMTEVVSVLERFIANPAQTRHELRVKLGKVDELAADVFALTVFLCDELLQLKPANATLTVNPASAVATQFFTVAKKLPIELQMILCHRTVGSMKQNILCKDSEATFKSLAQTLLLPQLK